MNDAVAIQKTITAQGERKSRLPDAKAQFRTFLSILDGKKPAPVAVETPKAQESAIPPAVDAPSVADEGQGVAEADAVEGVSDAPTKKSRKAKGGAK